MFFSMTPMLVVVIAVVGYFLGTETAQSEVLEKLRLVIGADGIQALTTLLANPKNPQSGLFASTVAGILMMLGATSVFVELKDSLDELWGIKTDHQSAIGALFRSRFLAFALIVVLTLLLLVSLLFEAMLALLEQYASYLLSHIAILFSALSSLFSFSIIACLFAVIFKMLPDAPLSWRDVWSGALVTATLFGLGKYLIGLYLSNSGIASSFGVAGSLIALLLWIYYSAQIFFLGAEFTRQYALCFGSLQQND
jgi:membrane protein